MSDHYGALPARLRAGRRPRVPEKLEVYKDVAGEWRWRLRAANGLIVADSGEGYEHRVDALDEARKVLRDSIEMPAADDLDELDRILDETNPPEQAE